MVIGIIRANDGSPQEGDMLTYRNVGPKARYSWAKVTPKKGVAGTEEAHAMGDGKPERHSTIIRFSACFSITPLGRF
jgi:hypothetical protein